MVLVLGAGALYAASFTASATASGQGVLVPQNCSLESADFASCSASGLDGFGSATAGFGIGGGIAGAEVRVMAGPSYPINYTLIGAGATFDVPVTITGGEPGTTGLVLVACRAMGAAASAFSGCAVDAPLNPAPASVFWSYFNTLGFGYLGIFEFQYGATLMVHGSARAGYSEGEGYPYAWFHGLYVLDSNYNTIAAFTEHTADDQYRVGAAAQAGVNETLAVPEPDSIVLTGAALALLAVAVRLGARRVTSS
jgi:hypothetical protein